MPVGIYVTAPRPLLAHITMPPAVPEAVVTAVGRHFAGTSCRNRRNQRRRRQRHAGLDKQIVRASNLCRAATVSGLIQNGYGANLLDRP